MRQVSMCSLLHAHLFVTLGGAVILLLVQLVHGSSLHAKGRLEDGGILLVAAGVDLLTESLDVRQDALATDGVRLVLCGQGLLELEVLAWDGGGTGLTDKHVGSQMHVAVALVVWLHAGCALLWGTDVHLIELEARDGLVDGSENPGSGADTGGFQGQTELEEDVHQWVGEEGDWEDGCDELPGDGSDDGGDEGSQKSSVEELLGGVRDIEDVLAFAHLDIESGDTGDDEEAHGDADLAADHESWKVASLSTEEKFASLAGNWVVSTFILWELGDREESDLHTLEHTDDGHEDEEEDDGDSVWNSRPHGGLSIEESGEGDGHGVAQDGEGEEDAAPVEGILGTVAWCFLGLDFLAGDPDEEHLDEVTRVQKSGELDGEGDVEGEDGEVVVDVVKHAEGGIDLGVELSSHGGHEDHGDSGLEEDLDHDVWESEDLGIFERGTALVDGEDHEEDHELTSHEVSVEVVTPVGEGGALVAGWVGFDVEVAVDWWETDEGTLSSLHHVEPDEGRNHDDQGEGWVDLGRDLGLFVEDESADDDEREDEEYGGVHRLEELERIHGCLVGDELVMVVWFWIDFRCVELG